MMMEPESENISTKMKRKPAVHDKTPEKGQEMLDMKPLSNRMQKFLSNSF